MVTKKVIVDQLDKIGFKADGWGRAEVSELPHIILPDEEIYECVNGFYDGGFALLVATNVRVLLIDKKPLNYLTVEDMRFDMINEMDYNHRLLGADIHISSGGKALRFRSYNQARLRKLIGHVQDCMAELKKRQDIHQEGQNLHLEQINKQLQTYLVAQQQYQQQIQSGKTADEVETPEPPKPSHELADFLYAQSLLAQHRQQLNKTTVTDEEKIEEVKSNIHAEAIQGTKFQAYIDNPTILTANNDQSDILEEAKKEIFVSKTEPLQPSNTQAVKHDSLISLPSIHTPKINLNKALEVNPIQVAYSKLPQALRSKKFSGVSNMGQSSTPPSTYPFRA